MLRPKERFLMRNATTLVIVALTLASLLAVYTFYRQNKDITAAQNWVEHTYETKGHIQSLQARARDAAGSARTYLFSNDETLLANYKEATRPLGTNGAPHHASSIQDEIAALRFLVKDNPVQQKNLDAALKASDDLLDYLSTTLKAHKTQPEKQQLITELDPRPVIQRINHLQAALDVMTAEENRLLAEREQEDKESVRRNSYLTFSLIGIFYIVLAFSIYAYDRARKRSRIALIRYARQLEQNEEELKASNEEIEASNEELEEQNARIRDQAEELRISKQLVEQKAQEIEQSSRYKTEFLANMSHELRTPLNSLLILARSLASNEDGNLTADQVEEATIIHQGGLELLNLINDILDLSKVEAGKMSLVVEEVEIDGIAQRMRQQFIALAREKQLAFPVEIEPGLPALLRTDVHRVEQILKNLLSNAFKFTRQGAVTLRIHRPENSLGPRTTLDSGNCIGFSVIDTGIGIDASRFKDIFEAFQQEDGSTDRHYGGTGLGLTIARKFAHLLGGEIRIASQKGVGSTFTLFLPRHLAALAPMPQAQGSLPPAPLLIQRESLESFIPDDGHSIKPNDKVLLIVEDDAAFATTLMKIARQRGYKCLVAGSGKTALLHAIEQPVTAVILDLKLPDIHGMQVLQQLKDDLRTRHIPVHIISAGDADQDTTLHKGAIGYTAKPVAREGIDAAFVRIEALLNADMKQILVIEDHADTQVALRQLLEKKDVHLTAAATGAEGLQQLQQKHFDCVILDLQLPDIDGAAWLHQATQALGDQGLPPVIIYTARDLTEDENRTLCRYTGSIVIKGGKSPERLLDEVTLFLHSVESTLPQDQRELLRLQHDPDQILTGRTILLVDDDMRNSFALSKTLRKHGLNIIIADNGQMALDKLQGNPTIDLVLMDIMMPVMDGYQAMREIRARPGLARLPIIALTARAMPSEEAKCMAAGANDFLTKPIDVERLLTLLRVWLFRKERAA